MNNVYLNTKTRTVTPLITAIKSRENKISFMSLHLMFSIILVSFTNFCLLNLLSLIVFQQENVYPFTYVTTLYANLKFYLNFSEGFFQEFLTVIPMMKSRVF